MTNGYRTRLVDFISDDLLLREAPLEVDEELLFSGLLDSIAIMRLIGFIESDLRVSVPPEDVTLEHFASVEAMALYLEACAARAG